MNMFHATGVCELGTLHHWPCPRQSQEYVPTSRFEQVQGAGTTHGPTKLLTGEKPNEEYPLVNIQKIVTNHNCVFFKWLDQLFRLGHGFKFAIPVSHYQRLHQSQMIRKKKNDGTIYCKTIWTMFELFACWNRFPIDSPSWLFPVDYSQLIPIDP